jgi:hypothetical protein
MSPPPRYEVPFYALPLVNFFIIDEMGVTNQDKELLSALQSLEFSPAYAVKGNQNCTWWVSCYGGSVMMSADLRKQQ